MAKSDSNSTFGDFQKKIKLSPDRMNLKPVNPKLSFEQYFTQAIREGHQLLDDEAKNAPTGSVTKTDSVKLEDKLSETSKNAYVRARAEILNKMTPITRSIIEKMERNEMEKDLRWDTFCKAVTLRGDQISSDTKQ